MINPARDEMLNKIRTALQREADTAVRPIPATARVAPRSTGRISEEIDQLFAEINKLGGVTQHLANAAERQAALVELVANESIRKATLWQTKEIKRLGIAKALTALGVEIISPYADHRAVAECDLGVTGADFALPETGTLALRSSSEQPRTVSLLPRVHLAIIRRACLRADLHQVLAEAKQDHYFVFVTGPSRTADIELTVTIGVHGPKALQVWLVE